MSITTPCEQCGGPIDVSWLMEGWWSYIRSLFRPHICRNPRWECFKALMRAGVSPPQAAYMARWMTADLKPYAPIERDPARAL